MTMCQHDSSHVDPSKHLKFITHSATKPHACTCTHTNKQGWLSM